MKYDVESFVKQTVAILKAGLPAEIAAINAEKADDITLECPDNSGWCFQNLNEDFFNFEPFVIYVIEDASISQAFKGANAKTISLTIEIGFTDSGLNPNDITWKLLRYSRAIEDTFSKNYQKFDSAVDVSIGALSPLSVVVKGKTIFSAGVRVSASLTN